MESRSDAITALDRPRQEAKAVTAPLRGIVAALQNHPSRTMIFAASTRFRTVKSA